MSTGRVFCDLQKLRERYHQLPASSFSVYEVVLPTVNPDYYRYTVLFKKGDTVFDRQILIDENIENNVRVTDPGVPDLDANERFLGWAENLATDTVPLTFGEINNEMMSEYNARRKALPAM